MKKIITLIMSILFTSTLFAGEFVSKGRLTQVTPNKNLVVGLVLSTGGLGSGFNRMAYDALVKLKSEKKIKDFKFVEPSTETENSQFLSDFSSSGNYDLVIGMGSPAVSVIKDIQSKYPKQKYVIIACGPLDYVIPNTTLLSFDEASISFLAGSLGAMMTKTKIIGIMPAYQSPMFDRFIAGYKAGAKYINPNVSVMTVYLPSSSASPWNDPITGKNIALQMADQKVDVIFPIAELTADGVFKAAKERGIFAFGCDADEDAKMPGTILTSVRQRLDNGVYNIVSDLAEGKFYDGYLVAGFKGDYVSLTEFKYTKDIIGASNLKKLEQIKKDIISGKIKIN